MVPAVFDNDDEAFLDWMKQNPEGFVLNTGRGGSSGYLWVHRSGCSHISGYASNQKPGAFSERGYIKVCSNSASDLDWWARENRPSGSSWNVCTTCAPDVDKEIGKNPPDTPTAADLGDPPGRVQETTYRILRDSRVARAVKELHGHRCQICGVAIGLPDGTRYAEAHHIRPLGSPHDGPDTAANVLCVCPNHHAELDYLARPIDLEELRLHPGHEVGARFIAYHNEQHRRTMEGA